MEGAVRPRPAWFQMVPAPRSRLRVARRRPVHRAQSPPQLPPEESTATPTAPPTATPTAPPTATPTAIPTQRPTPTPTVAPTPTPTPNGVPSDNHKTLGTSPGYINAFGVFVPPSVNGADNQWNPIDGDTPSGGHGPIGNTIDGIPCEVEMSNNYHIHIFVGLYVNGTEIALPRGVGAVEPQPAGQPNYPTATTCFYFLHTHDASGVVHVEDMNNNIVEFPPNTSKFTLGNLFDIWGITVNQNQFGPFAGSVRVFTSGQLYRHSSKSSTVPESTLTRWNADPNTIPLWSHEVIWFLVGPTYPTSLPSVEFYEDF